MTRTSWTSWRGSRAWSWRRTTACRPTTSCASGNAPPESACILRGEAHYECNHEHACRRHEAGVAAIASCGPPHLRSPSPLEPEDYVVQSMPDASPTKWHLAHTTWFFEEFVLQHAVPATNSTTTSFVTCSTRITTPSGRCTAAPQRGLLSRPTVAQVMAYRERIDERMNNLLQRQDLPAAIQDAITIGLHHEQQHQELLLTDIKHLFSCNPLLPAYTQEKPAPTRPAPALEFRDFEGGLIEIGHSGEGFSYDNEVPRHRTYTDSFRLANRAVTNGEYLEFVRAGGYEDPIHWLSDGWNTVQKEGWKRPFYWAPSLEQEFTLTVCVN